MPLSADQLSSLGLPTGEAGVPSPAIGPTLQQGSSGLPELGLTLVDTLANMTNPQWLSAHAPSRETALPMIGGSLALAAPGAGALPGAALAALGGGLGAAANVGIDAVTGTPQTTDPLARVAGNAALAGVGEGVGRGLVGGAEKLLAPQAGGALSETLDTAREMRAALPPNSLLRGTAAVRPPAVSRSTFVQWLNRKATQHNYGRDMLLAQDDYTRSNLVNRMYAETFDSIGKDLSDEELGNLFVDTAIGNRDVARAPATSIYDSIRQIASGDVLHDVKTSPAAAGTGTSTVGRRTLHAGGIQVNFDDTVRRPLLAVSHELSDMNTTTGAPELDAFIRRLGRTPDQLRNFNDVWEERTKLRDLMRGAESVADNRAVADRIHRYGKQVDRALTNGLEDGLQNSPYPQLADWLRTADRIYAGATETHTPFMVNRLVQLVNDNHAGLAETIVQRIFGPKGGQPPMGPQAIEKLRLALKHPETGDESTWSQFQGWYVRSGLTDANGGVTGQFDGKRLQGWLDGELRSKRLQSVLRDKPETIDALRSLAKYDQFRATQGGALQNPAVGVEITPAGPGFKVRSAATVGAGIGGTIGGVAGGYPGAALGAGLGGATAAGATALGQLVLGGRYASQVAGMLLTNPASARWLAEGARLPAGTKAAFGVTSRLIAQSANYERVAEYRDRLRQYMLQKGAAAEDIYQQMLPAAPTEPDLQPVTE